MASHSTAYSDEDIRLIKWTFMITRVASRPLRLVLENETVGKGTHESFWDYFKRKHKKLKNLYAVDEDMLKDCNTKLEDLDITLLYKVIRHGNRQLANGGEKDKWKEGNSHLESLITEVKDLRNELFHKEPQISEQEFKERTEMLRKLLTDLMSCVAKMYSIDVTLRIAQVNKDIDKYQDNDIEDEDIVSYRFDKHCERLKTEGKENIKDQYRNLKETEVNTVNHIVDLNSPVDDIFSDLELEKSHHNGEKITYHRILEGICYISDDPVILLEGDPGVGKTTLVKKVLSEWMNNTKSVKGLHRFSLVLHHEFRNEVTEDFNTLLKERMPDIAKSLKDDELRKAALHVKSLIILDGFDEVNNASALLFKEILDLKRRYGITVMITSRPEKLRYIKQKLNDLKIKLKHICLLGIPLDQREAFVEKYHKKMTEENTSKRGEDTPDIDSLKKYLEDTKYRLMNLWRLPYNLTLLTILYVAKLINLYNISTAPELYQEIFRLYRTKLKERLRDFPETKHLQDSELESIIDIFIHSLAKESISGLMKNQINLPEEAYKRLEGVCTYVKVPAEQMIGAFLKFVPNTGFQNLYGYPHKGIQDYLSARYIWMLSSGEYQSMEIHKVIRNVFSFLSSHSGSPHFSHRIMRVVEEELKERERCHIKGISQQFDAESTIKDNEVNLAMNSVPRNIIEDTSEYLRERFKEISVTNKATVKTKQSLLQKSTTVRDILQDIHKECFPTIGEKSFIVSQSEIDQQIGNMSIERESESDTELVFEIGKFQNMLFCLLGLFSSEGNEIQDEVKLETLKLLEETGVKDRDSWLNLLSSVKCDSFVADFIAREIGIFNKDIAIDDSTLFPYLSLLKSLKNPPENAENINVNIAIQEDTDCQTISALLHQLNRFNMKVTTMMLHTLFRNPSACQDPQLQTEICRIMERCPVEEYRGSMCKGLVVSTSVRELFVSVGNEDSINTLNECLQSHTLDILRVCVSADSNHLAMKPLPHWALIYIVDVREDNIQNVLLISKNLQPVTGDKKFFNIFFPRCNIPIQHQLDLIHSFERMGIGVNYALYFPSSNAPKQQQQQLIREEAKKKLGCDDVYWGGTDPWGFSLDDW